jgi:hypothetical protein
MLVILESPILRVLRDPMWQTDPHVCSQTKQKPCNEPICNPNKNWLLSMGITHWNLVGFHPLIKCHLANPSICLEKTRENPPISNFKDILLRFPPISSCMGVGIFIPFHVMCMYIYIYHISYTLLISPWSCWNHDHVCCFNSHQKRVVGEPEYSHYVQIIPAIVVGWIPISSYLNHHDWIKTSH